MARSRPRMAYVLVPILGVVVLCALVVVAYSCTMIGLSFWEQLSTSRYYLDYKARSSPLETEVVADLCAKLDLSPEDWRCKQGAVVYAPDFFPEIEHLEGTAETYDDIEALFGNYRVFCSQAFGEVTNPDAYFQCNYDLRGDGFYLFSCRFHPGGKVVQIRARAIPGGPR